MKEIKRLEELLNEAASIITEMESMKRDEVRKMSEAMETLQDNLKMLKAHARGMILHEGDYVLYHPLFVKTKIATGELFMVQSVDTYMERAEVISLHQLASGRKETYTIPFYDLKVVPKVVKDAAQVLKGAEWFCFDGEGYLRMPNGENMFWYDLKNGTWKKTMWGKTYLMEQCGDRTACLRKFRAAAEQEAALTVILPPRMSEDYAEEIAKKCLAMALSRNHSLRIYVTDRKGRENEIFCLITDSMDKIQMSLKFAGKNVILDPIPVDRVPAETSKFVRMVAGEIAEICKDLVVDMTKEVRVEN